MVVPSPDEKIATLDQVLELAVLINRDMASSLAGYGLTPARTHLLWELFHRGPSTQRVLADALRVSARHVTGLVVGLEETGYVTRGPHPGDRRGTRAAGGAAERLCPAVARRCALVVGRSIP